MTYFGCENVLIQCLSNTKYYITQYLKSQTLLRLRDLKSCKWAKKPTCATTDTQDNFEDQEVPLVF